jgi:DNA polymerase elongation subunit (family B)
LTKPSVLFLDIETFPLLAHVWEVYEANALDVVTHSVIACFSAKWQDGAHITKALPDYPKYKAGSEDDKAIVAELRDLLDEADIVVWQNGNKFDRKKINVRILKHGIQPPSPYQQVDTLTVARSQFGFPSKKLDAMGEYLGIGRKAHTGGYILWQKCMNGDMTAWRTMKRYNKQDVVLLESVYDRFLPWMVNHPNHGAYTGISSCPKCGSTKMQARGRQVAATRTYHRYQCMACGGWARTTESIKGERASVVNAR